MCGGYHLKHQQFSVQGKIEDCGFLQFPVSKGLIEKSYRTVGILLPRDALRRSPMLLITGAGGVGQPLPRLLKASGWTTYEVPFFFKVVNSGAFLANLTFLRHRHKYRLLLDALRYSGIGWMGAQALRLFESRLDATVQNSVVPRFGDWTDAIWHSCQAEYSFSAVRDSRTLNTLFPPSEPRYIRLRFDRGSKTIGWALVLDTQMSGHKQFGSMRVGSIVDCLAAAKDVPAVVGAATAFLQKRNVDLIVSNQSGEKWCDALRRFGFRRGPSNSALCLSPKLSAAINASNESLTTFHINRGDGDVPTNL